MTGVQLVMANGTIYDKPGKLNFLASNIDTTLGTQALRAEFTNPDNQLLPGQFVRIRQLTGERDGVFLVPQSAVVQTEQGALVMLLGGLKAGDKVIIDNLMKLRPGAPVAPHPPVVPGAPATAPAAAPAKQG